MYLNSREHGRESQATDISDLRRKEQSSRQVIALRIDFVARPDDKIDVASELGNLLSEAGLHEHGLQASLLLVSDREARLVTLLTLWNSEQFCGARDRLTSWTLKLVETLADGPTRVSTGLTRFMLPRPSKLTLADLRPAELAELVEMLAAG